jgi:hypothetical protein
MILPSSRSTPKFSDIHAEFSFLPKTSNPKYVLASSFLVVEGDVTYGFAKWHRCFVQQKRDSLYQSLHQKNLCMLKKQKRCSLNCKTYLISKMNKFAMEESNKSAIDLSSKKSRIGNSSPLAPYSSEIWLEILAYLNKIAMENRNGQHIILPSFVNELSQYTHTEDFQLRFRL